MELTRECEMKTEDIIHAVTSSFGSTPDLHSEGDGLNLGQSTVYPV